PRFTIDVPNGWRVLGDNPDGAIATDSASPGAGEQEVNILAIHRLAGVADDEFLTGDEYAKEPAQHRRPLPFDRIGWLRSLRYFTVRDLPPAVIAGRSAPGAVVTVGPLPARQLGFYDCHVPCAKAFV